jgi:predicted CoA-binding protein
MHTNPSDHELRNLLQGSRTIAMVGASSNPDRASFGVMRRLQRNGFRVIPVNPNETTVHGERAFASLTDVQERVDIVSVFRRPEFTPPIADDAVTIGAKAIWLQSGIWNDDTARRAKAGGLIVVMDACIATVVVVMGISVNED